MSMNEAITRPTVSIMKACVMAGVTRRTIYNWVQKGKVEYIRTAGGSIRIFTDTLFTSGSAARPKQ
jgi:excisionase family DNA binding protein